MLHLPNVTLLQVDNVNEERALFALEACTKYIVFGCVAMLPVREFQDGKFVANPEINSHEDYNRFVVKDLHRYFDTDFVLIIQHDGYVLNPLAWSDEFLQYDYIGAPWSTDIAGEERLCVGNGGFSLRSKKFCIESSKIEAGRYCPEDVLLCRTNRDLLESKGIRFAPKELAHKFSWEQNRLYPTYKGQFGFHGVKPSDSIIEHTILMREPKLLPVFYKD